MFERYINYNQIAEEMIRSREDNLAALASLWEQFEEMEEAGGLRGVSCENDRVHDNKISDMVANLAMRREAVRSRIEDLDRERKIYDMAWSHLNDDEREVLDVFFKRGMKKQDAVDLLCESFEREPATIYRKKDAALKRFKKLLFG
ncbi:hypothetical protein [Bacilliculturomica massiliensis]|uniref:hypothetical protein n=1 Tax=Bacilliculturomica massiliensis TaxID=1917867 RepID=UPI00102F8E64|nr:hypothetical protein [Bacilliculturomica massiliensis]